MIQKTNQSVIKEFEKFVPDGYCQSDDIVVASGRGSYFTDIEGREYLDFSSGIFTNTFGHAFAPFIRAEIAQIQRCDNIHGRRSMAELEFYKLLDRHMPASDYVFIPYNDGGYAVDRGLSDIINYFNKQRIPVAAFRGGFHGKTMGTKLTINETAPAALFDNFQVDFPNCYRCPWGRRHPDCQLGCVKDICETLRRKQTRAILFELVQGSGVVVPPAGFWEQMAAFCKENNIVMFADEVLTGGGRTGTFLASAGYNIRPDVISVTKGLANGRPLSVLCERRHITNNPYGRRPGERSSTFAAHPVNMAVAAENLRCLDEYNIFENVRRQATVLADGLCELKRQCARIGDVRAVGLMGAIEFVVTRAGKEPDVDLGRRVFRAARKNGLETIGGGHIIRLAPPLNITSADLIHGIEILSHTINQEVQHVR